MQYSCVDCIMSVKTGLRTIMRNRLGLTLTSVPTPTCTPRCNYETAQEDDFPRAILDCRLYISVLRASCRQVGPPCCLRFPTVSLLLQLLGNISEAKVRNLRMDTELRKDGLRFLNSSNTSYYTGATIMPNCIHIQLNKKEIILM